MEKHSVFSPIALPCGRTLQNRLVKVAMYEHMAAFLGGPPNEHHFSLYSEWAKSDWGMMITGNVQVSRTHLTLGRDITLPDPTSGDSLEPFRELASSMLGSGKSNCNGSAIMQLSHAGRQSPNLIGGRYPFQRPSGPSPVRVRPRGQSFISDLLHTVAFQTPHGLSEEEIQDIIAAFVKGAIVALNSGFDGVQLHAAHGYVFTQFISPKSNTRNDDYSTKNALRLLHQVVVAIRSVVPRNFVLGIKINAADYVATVCDDTHKDNLNPPDDALHHIRVIASWGLIDFIEISGGDYEKPEFMTVHKSLRQALFSTYSQKAVQTLSSLLQCPASPQPLILLTGGLRTPELLYTALASRDAHLLGIGRGSVLCPHLPTLLKEREDEGRAEGRRIEDVPGWDVPFSPEPDLELGWRWMVWLWGRLPKISLLGGGVNMAWYVVEMRRLAEAGMENMDKPSRREAEKAGMSHHLAGAIGAVFWMWVWVDERTLQRMRVLVVWCLQLVSFVVLIVWGTIWAYLLGRS